jgi:hypothetical protein
VRKNPYLADDRQLRLMAVNPLYFFSFSANQTCSDRIVVKIYTRKCSIWKNYHTVMNVTTIDGHTTWPKINDSLIHFTNE